jgi:Planctomycete cytochrome C
VIETRTQVKFARTVYEESQGAHRALHCCSSESSRDARIFVRRRSAAVLSRSTREYQTALGTTIALRTGRALRLGQPRSVFGCGHAMLRCVLPLLSLAVCLRLAAAEIDTNRLPPAATVEIDFARDIQPVLDNSCLRCHGPEKPKSHFRLDNRQSALKGGENGMDIIPGNSIQSPLIHYVAGLVEDMHMPPPDKGEPLTHDQIGLLRAWIDQGANWDTNAPSSELQFSIAPTVRWIGVEGDKAKFREIEGVKEGWAGGIQEFELHEKVTPDETFSIEGHALPRDEDFLLKLALEKNDAGFVRGGFETWRKYYDDTGGFAQVLGIYTNSFSLNRDLHLDIGRVWFDVGLTLPDRPQVVLGYEYQYKQGDKSTLQWGQVGDSSTDAKYILPAYKHVDEKVHIVKLDLSHTIDGWRLEDSARVELYRLETSRPNAPANFNGPPPDAIVDVAERERHTQGMNTLSASKQLKSWLFVSGGYLYSRLEGDAALRQNTQSPSGSPVRGDQWSANNVLLKRESQVASLGGLLGPWSGLTLSFGIQGEWTRQESFGNEDLQNLDAGNNANHAPSIVIGRLDSASARENVSLRLTRISHTVVFAEARLRQESLGRFESGQIVIDSPTPDLFNRNTDADIESEEYRVGFDTSPWQRLSLGASVRHSYKHTDYVNLTSHTIPELQPGYPGFFLWRDIEDNQAQARLVWRAAPWLKTSFNYRYQETDFSSATPSIDIVSLPGGRIEAANQDAHVYSVNFVLTPFRRLYLSSTFSYTDSRIATALDGAGPLVPYEGNVFSVLSSATFALNAKTDLRFNYVYSKSDYRQNNHATGLPAGIDYERHSLRAGVTRRVTKNLVTSVTYGFSQYLEPTSGGVNDYTAHAVFATAAISWP